MIYGTHEVELPDHDTALQNINWNDTRLLVRRTHRDPVRVLSRVQSAPRHLYVPEREHDF
jgi:hypothetical protein